MTDQIENQQEKLSNKFIADNMALMARDPEACSVAFGFDWQQELCANALRLLEEYDGVLRELCSYLAAGGYNSEGLINPQTADSKIRDGIDHIIKVEKSRAIPEGHVVVPKEIDWNDTPNFDNQTEPEDAYVQGWNDCRKSMISAAHALEGEAVKEEGWIEWYGGNRPVPDETQVDVKVRSGPITFNTLACTWDWTNTESDPGDIIAYRVVKEKEE